MKAFGVLFTVVEHDNAASLRVPGQSRHCVVFEALRLLGVVKRVVTAQNIPHDNRPSFFQCNGLQRRELSVGRSKHDRICDVAGQDGP